LANIDGSSAFAGLLARFRAELESGRGFTRQIPDALDQCIARLVEAWTAGSGPTPSAPEVNMSAGELHALIAFARRTASVAVRTKTRDPLRIGLRSLALEGWRVDGRENVVALVIMYDAASRIGARFDSLVRESLHEVANLAVRDHFIQFLGRSEAANRLSAVGMRAVDASGGFHYEQDPARW